MTPPGQKYQAIHELHIFVRVFRYVPAVQLLLLPPPHQPPQPPHQPPPLLCTVIEIVVDVVVAPLLSVATAVMLYVPAGTFVQLYAYGEPLSVLSVVEPFLNCTFCMVPSGSVAIASICIVAGATNGAILFGIVSVTVGY